ncbi:E3 ubiquitin-protein ligase RNF213-like [Ruditapes philippinarum]|uniref:E3 ubiquitin-protein ligase RNF213-like n=1 Tax=Ruditapes philippinarum TaxID=129788 RepID=UPI00295C330B|nr:E3 ubiquitin-protein ligase RNF213-like [Ruditapes philippinarum]
MAEKENEPLATTPDMWLSKEAASIVAIEKFGTFRRACIEAFDTRMSPILGGLFAALDTNHNLNLLECGVGTWQRNLWIALINTKEVGVHLFTKVHTERGLQFEVHGTGYSGRLFQCKVPFSWIMLSTIDAILQQRNFLMQETNKQEEILGEMELIRAIDSVPKEDFYDVFESYINDFVQTVYPEKKDRHLVFMSIMQMTLGRITSENTSVSAAFILVHQVYQETKPRLNYYRDISNVWCGCTDAVMACHSNFDDPEENLEFLGLTTLIEHILPKGKVDITEWFQSDSNRDNWLGQVQRYRQVVNQTLAFCQEEITNYALVAKERSRWNRIVVMQLCIENLTPKENKSFPIDIFPLLWKLLDEGNMDVKCIEPLKEIERFLVVCFKKTKNSLIREAKTCVKCGIVMTSNSKTIYCEKCEATASVETIDQDISKKEKENPQSQEHDEQQGVLERVREYRQRCNLVLMDIVSQLCFADNTSPDSDAIEWLLSYSFKSAIGEDQQLLKENETDIGVDSTKNFTAFLFKHLLRADGHEFSRHLVKFVNTIDRDGSQSKELDDVIVSLIFIIEDYLLEISTNEICNLEIIGEYLGDSLHLLKQNSTSVDQIYGIAQARAALSVTASCIDLVTKQKVEHGSKEMGGITAVLQVAESLCKQRTLIWKFLLKHLAQEFGTDTLLAACKSSNAMVNWIAMDANVTSTVDMYTACGEEYCTIKCLLLTSLIESEQDKVLPYIQSMVENQALVVMFELAVHREFLLHHRIQGSITTTQEHKLVEKIGQEFKERCQNASLLALDANIHMKYNIQVSKRTIADREMSIKCILFHWLCVITHFNCSRNGILRPLFKLALQPGDLKDVFLPCMPEDELAMIRQQMLDEGETALFGERTKYYRCENGHGYEIGQFGRPLVKAKCLCGADIRGESFMMQRGNEPDNGSDRSQKGHCLGSPEDRQPGPVPERSLSALQNALLKCLLHLSMYLGCGHSQNDVSVMVKQQPDSIQTFIWDHILVDFEDLMCGMSLNRDECLLLMHSLIDSILRTGIQTDCIASAREWPQQISPDEVKHEEIETLSVHRIENESKSEDEVQTESSGQFHSTDFLLNEEQPWETKLGRGRWEEEFAKLFLTRFLEERKTTLNLAKRYLEGCSTTGILAVLYDKQTDENIQENKEDSKISDNPLVWIYRKPVSVEHFKQAFQRHMDTCSSGEKKFTVLSMFLKQINALQALRFVPSILQLNKTLIQRYNRQIYQSEASKITVKQIKEDVFAGEDAKLFEDMFEAWKTVRNALKYHEFTTGKGRTAIPLEWANMRLTDETELAYLLPAIDGKGICTFALLDFLLRLQNEVIDTYLSSLSGEMKQVFTVVEPRDITAAHLINFHPEKDLLPIILENCTMSSTHIVSDEYDFKAIQKRIIDRFISTKSKVAFDRRFKIDLLVYRSEASQFHILHTKIPQERLDPGVKLALCNQVQDVPSLGQLLSQLDIAINFLNITGGEPGDSLHEYMLEKLQLTSTKLTWKIQQHCLLKHVKSLWMNFSFHRSYIMARQGKQVQVIFENIGSEYYETFPEDIVSVCQSFAKKLSMERLKQFLELLYEFIMLELAKRENKDDEDYLNQFRLMDCLTAFGDLNGLDVDVHDIPTSVLSIHSLHMWIVASQILESKVENKYETEI